RLRHRRDTLPERAALESVQAEQATVGTGLEDATARREEVVREEQRFDDEAQSLEEKAAGVERRMYSGEVTSPRELQALQADVDQLRRHRRGVADRELGGMERRGAPRAEGGERRPRGGGAAARRAPPAPAPSAPRGGGGAAGAGGHGGRAGELEAEAARLGGALAELEGEVDGELGVEQSARDEIAATVAAELLADYEQCRHRARGMGAARLNGNTCQGCHLSIPSVEAERIRRSPAGTVAHCDNCGCILVP